MNVRDRVERIKIRFKKLTGEFEKEEQGKKIKEMEMVYERIKEIPLEKWFLIKNEPDSWKEMREMYKRHRRSAIYCIFDDGSQKQFLKEFKFTLCAMIENLDVVFQTDGRSCGLLFLRFDGNGMEVRKIYLSPKLKISVFDDGFADFVRTGQDIVDRGNIESMYIDFFGNLLETLVPIEYSDFLSGQRVLPLFIPKAIPA